MTDQEVSLYYLSPNGDEYRIKGTMLKPPHVAREDGYMGIQQLDGTVTWVPWERIVRWKAKR